MKKIIKLNSRYKSANYLKLKWVSEETVAYTLETDLSYRIIYDGPYENKKIIAVDPSGGPMMYLGDQDIVKGTELCRIKEIDKDICLIFKYIM